MNVFQGKIARNGCNLLQMETKMGPEVQYFCWVLLSSLGVNNSLSTIFFGTPCIYINMIIMITTNIIIVTMIPSIMIIMIPPMMRSACECWWKSKEDDSQVGEGGQLETGKDLFILCNHCCHHLRHCHHCHHCHHCQLHHLCCHQCHLLCQHTGKTIF